MNIAFIYIIYFKDHRPKTLPKAQNRKTKRKYTHTGFVNKFDTVWYNKLLVINQTVHMRTKECLLLSKCE